MPPSLPEPDLCLLWLSEARSWIRHQIPLLGCIIAGRPELQEGRVDGCIEIDPTTRRLPKNVRTFALKVRGDSMRNAAILEGDIVAALIDGETTLKRYIVQGGVPYLRASNPKYPDLIPTREQVIQGVMVELLRLPKRERGHDPAF